MAAKAKEAPLAEDDRFEGAADGPPEKKPKKVKDKKTKEKTEKRKRRSSVSLAAVFAVILGLLIVGSITAILGFNVLDIRNRYVYPFLEQVPVVKNLIPLPESEEEQTESPEDLTARIRSLESQLSAAQRQADTDAADIESKNQEIERLKIIEQQQIDFRAEKEDLEARVAREDPLAYSTYLEKVAPERAEELYPAAKAEIESQNEIKRYIAAINESDESSAAQMLEQLVATDLNLVVSILKGLNAKKSGAILENMTPENGAAVLKRWDPLSY